jgi:hypothetical protein
MWQPWRYSENVGSTSCRGGFSQLYGHYLVIFNSTLDAFIGIFILYFVFTDVTWVHDVFVTTGVITISPKVFCYRQIISCL